MAAKRDQKLYGRFDALAAQYLALLLHEFQRPDESYYLQKRLKQGIVRGREFRIHYHPRKEVTESVLNANTMLELEKDILHLCEKLHEPTPPSLETLYAYIAEFNADQKGRLAWDSKMPAGMHNELRKRTIERLQAGA